MINRSIEHQWTVVNNESLSLTHLSIHVKLLESEITDKGDSAIAKIEYLVRRGLDKYETKSMHMPWLVHRELLELTPTEMSPTL